MLLIFVQLDFAWTLDGKRRQWIDMRIATGVCMVNPESCTAGGAISFWLNVVHFGQGLSALVQSYDSLSDYGGQFEIRIGSRYLRYYYKICIFFAIFHKSQNWSVQS